MTPSVAVISARQHAEQAWRLFTQERNHSATIADWRTSNTLGGTPLLSAQVEGPGVAHTLERFARDYHLVLNGLGDQRPQYDTTVPGRIVLVRRFAGVWVELWHPDPIPDAPEPKVAEPAPAVPVAAAPAGRALRTLLHPSGRLPFTRNRSPRPQEAS